MSNIIQYVSLMRLGAVAKGQHTNAKTQNVHFTVSAN